jgi:hypothetical protein
MGDMRDTYRVPVRKPARKRRLGRLEEPGVDGRIIVKWIFKT